MTRIFFTKRNDKFVGFTTSGHTNKAEHGKDVLCAAISTASQMTVCGIVEVAKVKAKVKIKSGFLSLELEEATEQTELLIKTLYKTLCSICENEKKYVKLEVRDDN